jgi:hypothetical protein
MMRAGLRLASTAGYVVLGAAALALSLGMLGPSPSPLVIVFGGLLPTSLALALVAAGIWVTHRSDLTLPEVRDVSMWGLSGMASFGSFGLAFVILADGQFGTLRPELLLAETVVGGALAGTGIGLYDVLSQRQRARLHTERERLDVLNRMLRHHLLNGMNIILANAEEMEHRAQSPSRELETIQRRGLEVVGLVEQVSSLTDRIHEQPEPRPLPLDDLLTGPVARARAAYGTRNVELEEPVPDVKVLGDETLQEAIEAVVFERAKVSDGLQVAATLQTEAVVVTVSDDSDVPVTAVDGGGSAGRNLFGGDAVGGSERYAASLNQGVDIYMAELLLSRSGGRLKIESEDGALVELYLLRA